MWRIAFIALLMSIAAPAHAGGILIGPICVDGVRSQQVSGDTTFASDGKWSTFHFQKAPGTSRIKNPMLVVFSSVPATTHFHETCSVLAEREVALGHEPILAGQIEQIDFKGHSFDANGGANRIQIDAGEFRAKLGHVLRGGLPLLGGHIKLSGSKLWISNSKTILIEPDKLTGEFEIEAWNRKVDGAKVSLDGADLAGLTLSPVKPNHQNLSIRLDLETNRARLWNARLEARSEFALKSTIATIAGIDLRDMDAQFQRIEVSASKGALAIAICDLKGVTAQAVQSNSKAKINVQAVKFTVDVLKGPATEEVNGLKGASDEMSGLRFDAGSGSIETPDGTTLLRGPTVGTIATLTPKSFQSSFEFSSPTSAVLDLLSGSAPSDKVGLAMNRDGDLLRLQGDVVQTALKLGLLSINSPMKYKIEEATTSLTDPDPVIEFPIDIHVPKSETATVEFHTPDYKVGLSGRLDGFDLEGKLVLPLNALEKCHLNVRSKKFFLGVGASAFLEPMIAGIKPTLADVDISFANPTDMDVGRDSKGRIATHVTALVLGQPVFNIGEGGSRAKASLSLTTRAGADLLYDLGAGRILIAQGEFVADDVRFHFLDPNGEIDLNGTRLANPDISLKHLEIRFTQAGDLEYGSASLVEFQAAGSRLYKPSDPSKPDELSYSARVAQPLSINRIDAFRVRYADVLSLEVLQVAGFSLKIDDGDISFGKDIAVVDARIGLSADAINNIQANGTPLVFIDKAAIDVRGKLEAGLNNRPHFHIGVHVSGPADKLSGLGDAEIEPFSGGRVSDMEVGFKCEGGDKLKVPTEFDFEMAGFAIVVHVKEGRFAGIGLTGPTGLHMHTIHSAQCHNETKKIVIVPEQSGWTWGVCFDPLPHKCKWSWRTDEINIKYNFRFAVEFASATIFLPHPIFAFQEKKVKACFTGMPQLMAPVFVGGYSPQIVSNFPGADKVVNDILAAGFEAFQTVIATGILNAVATSNVISLGQVACYV